MENKLDHAVRYDSNSRPDTNLGGISLGTFTKLIVISNKVYVDSFLTSNHNKLVRNPVEKTKQSDRKQGF